MKKREKRLQLPEALGAYEAKRPARFHMPGHKGRTEILEKLVAWDFTELEPTDDLAHPEGAILASEDAISRVYGARHSFMCVNGSTSCILTMLLSLGKEKRVLLARDCHRSALSGVALAGHEASFVYPAYDATSKQCGVVTAREVEKALEKAELDDAPIDAVTITSPNYYGLIADIEGIAAVCNAYGAQLFVDAAHAAHFPFISSLKQYLPQGDEVSMFCTSTHKTLAALTQTALLHVGKRCPLNDAAVRRAMALTETSSPSYVLMSSIDLAVHDGLSGRYERHYERILELRKRILNSFNGIELLDPSMLSTLPGACAIDETRLTLNVSSRGITGTQAAHELMKRDIYPEMADFDSVVLITSPDDQAEWYERLLTALDALPYGKAPLKAFDMYYGEHERALPVRDAMLERSVALPISMRLKDRISAGTVGIYPPGTALIAPGERISERDIEKLQQYKKTGLNLFGLENGNMLVVE